jgi:nickel transport protein
MKRVLVAVVLGLVLFGFPAQALAHQVETFYFVKDELEFQSTFSTGEPFVGATVEIYAPNNPDEPWLTLTTDEEGRFSFLPDESIQGDWEVSIEQDGHADYWTVPVGEKGIEYDNIVMESNQDLHYASFDKGLVPLALALVSGMVWLTLRNRWRLFRS